MKLATLDTYATLCIYSDTEPKLATEVERITGLSPSRTVENKQPPFPGFPRVRKYGWFLTSRESVNSLDAADHIQWICSKIRGPEVVVALTERFDVRLSCFWSSDGVGGGPVLPNDLLTSLAALQLSLEFDVYIGCEEPRH